MLSEAQSRFFSLGRLFCDSHYNWIPASAGMTSGMWSLVGNTNDGGLLRQI